MCIRDSPAAALQARLQRRANRGAAGDIERHGRGDALPPPRAPAEDAAFGRGTRRQDMTSNERELKHLVDRHLPSPTHMEFTAARDRVLDQLRAKPAHLQTPRIAESAPPVSRWRTGVAPVSYTHLTLPTSDLV